MEIKVSQWALRQSNHMFWVQTTWTILSAQDAKVQLLAPCMHLGTQLIPEQVIMERTHKSKDPSHLVNTRLWLLDLDPWTTPSWLIPLGGIT